MDHALLTHVCEDIQVSRAHGVQTATDMPENPLHLPCAGHKAPFSKMSDGQHPPL